MASIRTSYSNSSSASRLSKTSPTLTDTDDNDHDREDLHLAGVAALRLSFLAFSPPSEATQYRTLPLYLTSLLFSVQSQITKTTHSEGSALFFESWLLGI